MDEPTKPVTASLGQVARKGALWSVLAQGCVALSSVVAFALLGRMVGPELYGEYVFAALLLAGVQWLSLNAYKEPVIQAAQLQPGQASSVFWFTLVVGSLLAIVMLGIAAYLSMETNRVALSTCVAVLAIKVFADTLSAIPLAMRARELDFKFLSLNTALAGGIMSAVAITLLLLGFGIVGMALGQVAGAVSLVAVPLLFAPWRPRFHFVRSDLSVLRRYSPHVITWQAVEMVNACFDRFFVATRLSVAALGVYGFARRLNEVVIEVLVGGVSSVAFPTFSTIQDDKPRLQRAFLRAVRIITFIVLPVIGMLFVSAEEVITLVFGDRWLQAAPVYRCFLLLGIIQTIGVLQASLIRSLGHASVWSRYLVFQTIGNVAVVFAFIDSGIFALALALVVKTYAVWIWAVLVTCRLIGISVKDYLLELARPLLCAVLAALIAYLSIRGLWPGPGIVHTAAMLAVGATLYILIAHVLNRAGFAEVLGLLKRA